MLVSLGCLPWVVESLGWNWAFYSSGILALMWTPLWFLLVRDDPLRHPCIAHKERELLKEITIQTKRSVPWYRLATCPTVYILALVEFAVMWYLGFIVVQGPTLLVTQVWY
ncbi:hypothetical protein Pmani_002975 [Petrolisthes manimaculis]|uniref:Uncharacterized protein n=1 Tax=Petrolisthes manimaculis TaxID=1843537 RepID=A0AAE1UJW2_9EUCA|nr:hypothetical protein Pmani_002975 [Petrolisthes manimaculis]